MSAALTLTQALTCLSPMIVAGVVMIIWERQEAKRLSALRF